MMLQALHCVERTHSDDNPFEDFTPVLLGIPLSENILNGSKVTIIDYYDLASKVSP
jgi:hypothetical protein